MGLNKGAEIYLGFYYFCFLLDQVSAGSQSCYVKQSKSKCKPTKSIIHILESKYMPAYYDK